MSDLNLFGTDLFGEPITPKVCKLAEDFVVPPFSVLDARQGYWQERKRAWLSLGIKSELGRGQNALGREAECEKRRQGTYARTEGSGGPGTLDEQRKEWAEIDAARRASPGGNMMPAMKQKKDGITSRGNGAGDDMGVVRKNPPSAEDFGTGGVGGGGMCERVAPKKTNNLAPGGTGANTAPSGVGGADGSQGESGTSIFDPVLCEVAYRWFCPTGGHVLDPFAGGSVRGIVAAKLGLQYTGVDLRGEQCRANEEQAQAIVPDSLPRWVEGDAAGIAALVPGVYDLVFSCPPYGDLERYSDDPRDLSTMDYPVFLAALKAIVIQCVAMLKPDRFACFVVGDIRDRKGFYRSFVGDTIAAFREAGMQLYNDAVLITQVGSLPIRVGKQFAGYRKLGKSHQNVLVFFKGNTAAIKRWVATTPAEGNHMT